MPSPLVIRPEPAAPSQTERSARQTRQALIRSLRAAQVSVVALREAVTAAPNQGALTSALGGVSARADLEAAYGHLKAFILVLDPDADVPDLP